MSELTEQELTGSPGYCALVRHVEKLDARIVRIHQSYARRLQRLHDQLAAAEADRDDWKARFGLMVDTSDELERVMDERDRLREQVDGQAWDDLTRRVGKLEERVEGIVALVRLGQRETRW